MSKMIELGGRERLAPMVFVQADAAVPLKSGEGGATPEDKSLILQEFADSGRAAAGFDVVSCMFALHYMFRDEPTLHGFLTNLADTVKVGGYFVGCGFDGDQVAALLGSKDSVTGRDGDTEVWNITKRYGTSTLAPNASGLGLAIDVDFISIGETHTEYLVSWAYLQERMSEIGLELLTPEDQAAMGLSASSQLFKDALESAGKRYDMSDALKRYSFLNRWYIFKRIDAKRPMPLSAEARVKPPILSLPSGPSEKVKVGRTVETEEAPTLEVKEVAKPFLIDSSQTYDDRLGPDYLDWPRYLSLGIIVPAGIIDKMVQNPASIGGGAAAAGAAAPSKYPSVEAAIAAAKYQVATDKPELGPQIFRVDGALNQKFEAERLRLAGNDAAIRKTMDDQVGQTRTLSGAAKMKGFKAIWNKADWDEEKERVYRVYLKERYYDDERFKEIVDRVTKMAKENPFVSADGVVHPELMLVNGTEYNELGVGVKDGNVVGGDNKVGKWFMELSDSDAV
jgi:hypothetical protein